MPIPSLQLQKKIVLWREAEGLVRELWSPRFVQYSDCALSCAMRLLQKKNNCRDWDFSNSEMDVWLKAFQLPMFPKVTHCRKEICWTCLFKESIPAIPFWNSKHPTYQKLEVPESRSTFRHLCIKWWHRAHPFVAAAEKECVMQRSRGFGHGVVVPRIVTI